MSTPSPSVAPLTTSPDAKTKTADVFGFAPTPGADLETVPSYTTPAAEYVPAIDPHFLFDPQTTMALLAGFKFNRRVMVQGFHGTGKSSHVEQVAARLNWPCVRINLDSHISRMDLLGKDVIRLDQGKQVSDFHDGILTWALQRNVAVCFDEYDAGRPDVMFVIQRILESEGKLTLLDQSKVLTPHNSFRLFATTNTVGLGDDTGLYHGTQPLNQGQLDRWHIVTALNYLSHDQEVAVIRQRLAGMMASQLFDRTLDDEALIERMVDVAAQTRVGFKAGDVSTVMSPRTVISWVENTLIFGDPAFAFRLSFLNRCDSGERDIFATYYEKDFGESPIDDSASTE
ncbi:MAG: AAA family ATPase [Alphaproteobacteria bacterium]|nr:AAA family ATPase [Alphaproteobacteria bacterium]